jgi:FkbM family methyltransferase
MEFFKKAIRTGFNLIGFDIARISQVPRLTFLGLKNLPIKTVIDVGANEGQFAQMISAIYTDAKIYSFEPLSDVYQKLLLWTDKTKGRVSAFNVALGEEENTVAMHYHVDHDSSSSLLQTTQYNEDLFPQTGKQIGVSVKQTTLDNWMEEITDTLRPDILIKLDVQGYEDRVICGGKKLFTMAKACIIEINLAKLYHEQASFRDIFYLLDGLDYSYSGNLDQFCNNEGQVVYIDSLFIRKQ